MNYPVARWLDDPETTFFFEEGYMGTFRELSGTRHYFEGVSLRVVIEHNHRKTVVEEAAGTKVITPCFVSFQVGGSLDRIFVSTEKVFFQGREGVSNAWWVQTRITELELPDGYSGYRKVAFREHTDSEGAIKLG